MDITRYEDASLLRFVDDEAKAIIREGISLCAPGGSLAPPFGGIVHARSAAVIKGLLQTVSELLDRLAMADSYVETATQAVADELKVPGLTFDKVHDAFASAARNGEGPPTEALCPAESIMQWADEQVPHDPDASVCLCTLCCRRGK